MFLERLFPLRALVLLAPLGLGCQDYPAKVAPTPDAIVDGTPEGALPSLTSRLKARSGAVLANDLAQALELPRETVCNELGRYDCATEVHRIALGGVEPYVLGIQNPLSIAPITAPIAVDRMALSACTERARLDFEEMGQGLLSPLVVAGGPSKAAREEVARALFQKLLRRDATADEIAETTAFYDELAGGENADRDYAILSCFAVATHVEAIFY